MPRVRTGYYPGCSRQRVSQHCRITQVRPADFAEQPSRLPFRRVPHDRNHWDAVGEQGTAQCHAGPAGRAYHMNRIGDHL
jgi:hypothetical protein